MASLYASSSSARAGIRVSGTYLPPKEPNLPSASGRILSPSMGGDSEIFACNLMLLMAFSTPTLAAGLVRRHRHVPARVAEAQPWGRGDFVHDAMLRMLQVVTCHEAPFNGTHERP
jgi:hypothetical protein